MEPLLLTCTPCRNQGIATEATFICHKCPETLLCQVCLLQTHRQGTSFHDSELIELYATRLKQTVWLLITKLDRNILKLRYEVSRC